MGWILLRVSVRGREREGRMNGRKSDHKCIFTYTVWMCSFILKIRIEGEKFGLAARCQIHW